MFSRAGMFTLAALVVALDRASKLLVEQYVSLWDTYVVIPHCFNIVHSENRGAVFGMFSDSSGEWRTLLLVGFSSLVTVFVASLLWQVSRRGSNETRTLRIALALVLGGALGNMYDRLAAGTVTDFLDFYLASYHWHTFNLADSAITVGAGLLLADMWRSRRKRRPAPEAKAQASKA